MSNLGRVSGGLCVVFVCAQLGCGLGYRQQYTSINAGGYDYDPALGYSQPPANIDMSLNVLTFDDFTGLVSGAISIAGGVMKAQKAASRAAASGDKKFIYKDGEYYYPYRVDNLAMVPTRTTIVWGEATKSEFSPAPGEPFEPHTGRATSMWGIHFEFNAPITFIKLNTTSLFFSADVRMWNLTGVIGDSIVDGPMGFGLEIPILGYAQLVPRIGWDPVRGIIKMVDGNFGSDHTAYAELRARVALGESFTIEADARAMRSQIGPSRNMFNETRVSFGLVWNFGKGLLNN